MTKEELKQKLNNEASLYCQEYATLETYDSVHKAYIFSAEPREKRITELEAQIEKMKCCGNCEHATHDSMNGTFCKYYSEWEHADLKCTQWELRR